MGADGETPRQTKQGAKLVKITVEDQDLRKQILAYLELNGTTVDDDTPVSITLPGAGSAPQKCLSGSGLMTAGGKFAPGYDAKLKAALYAIIRDEPKKIPVELTPESPLRSDVIGPMYIPLDQWTPEKANAVLTEFDWPPPTIKIKPEPKVKKEDTEGESEDGEAKTSTSTRAGRKKAAAAAAAEAEAASTEDAAVV